MTESIQIAVDILQSTAVPTQTTPLIAKLIERYGAERQTVWRLIESLNTLGLLRNTSGRTTRGAWYRRTEEGERFLTLYTTPASPSQS